MARGKKTGGRQRGTPNRSTGELREIARAFGPAAIERLAQLACLAPGGKYAETPQAVQVAALKELLDRGYGRATQVLAGEDDAPPQVIEFRWGDTANSGSANAVPAKDTAE